MSNALVFAGSYRATGMRLVAGRDPEPASRTEFVATRGSGILALANAATALPARRLAPAPLLTAE